MVSRLIVLRRCVLFSVFALLVGPACSVLLAQRPPFSPGGVNPSPERPLTLLVKVREKNGIPLEARSVVRISPGGGGPELVSATQDASTATFPGVLAGDYDVEVDAPGYETAHEHTSVLGATTFTVYVYMTTAAEASKGPQARPGTVMTPDLQREMDQGLQALKQKKFDEARKHLEKAARKAPNNPDIQYFLGMIDYYQKNIVSARKHFEATLSLFPSHERTLFALAELQMEAGENSAAVQSLEKALQSNTVNWQTYLLLAYAYGRVGEFDKARSAAARTAELNNAKAPAAGILQGKFFLMDRKPAEARKVFRDVVHKFPADPAAKEAQAYLAKLDEREEKASEPALTELPLANAPIPEKPWAPPDVDASVPAVANDVACSVDDVVARAQVRTGRQLGNFERFGATEHIEHQEIDVYGVPAPVKDHDFIYVVTVHRPSKDFYFLDEYRDGAESLYSFPTQLATRGLVSMGVNIVHPVFSKDFRFTCDGLGQWRGHAAWQIRFEQKADVASRIRTWEVHGRIFPVPLRGRAWISANSYDLLHLETELREPVPDIDLKREHLVIDYGPVKFQHNSTELWLPWYAEMYFDIRGKRYHHRHTLTNYVLFDVDDKTTINDPKVENEK